MKRSALRCMAACSPLSHRISAAPRLRKGHSRSAPAKAAPLIPYVVGNQWMTMTTSYDRNGNLLSTEYDTSAIVETVAIDGETWYRIHNNHFRDLFATTRSDGSRTRADLDSVPAPSGPRAFPPSRTQQITAVRDIRRSAQQRTARPRSIRRRALFHFIDGSSVHP